MLKFFRHISFSTSYVQKKYWNNAGLDLNFFCICPKNKMAAVDTI